jgi:proteasome assembly chaperone (PAC2) family protein
MSDFLEIGEKPLADNIYLLAGWRQWADAGSISSGLPQYLIQQTNARKIGSISPDGFYIFQIPGTHDLVRPLVKFKNGYPEFLEIERNEFFYSGDRTNGLVIFLGDEPHMDVERYTSAILDAAEAWGVKRIIGLGGVYGELPYDLERMVSSVYSLPHLKEELDHLGVSLSEYQGGASIGSYLCSKASKQNMEYVSFYGFVPTYDFSDTPNNVNGITVENDYTAWLGIMQRVNHMLKLDLDLTDLREKSEHLRKLMDDKIEEIDRSAPEIDIRNYLQRLKDDFDETIFQPHDDFWEEELGRLFDNIDPDDES